MTQLDDLGKRRAELEAEIALIQHKIDTRVSSENEKRKLAEATAALDQVERTLALTSEAVQRREALAREAYDKVLAEQHANMKRQRELAAEIAKQKNILASAWNKAKPLVLEYRNLTAGSYETTRKLFDLAEAVGKGVVNPMNDIDGDGGTIDESFARLVTR